MVIRVYVYLGAVKKIELKSKRSVVY